MRTINWYKVGQLGLALMFVGIVGIAGVMVINRPPYEAPEPGIKISIDENGYNQGEKASFGVENFFTNTPLIIKLTGLNVSGNYLLLQVSNFLHDSRGGVLLQFTNRTEIIIVFQGFDCSLLLFRDGRGVIIISLIGTPVNELDLSALI